MSGRHWLQLDDAQLDFWCQRAVPVFARESCTSFAFGVMLKFGGSLAVFTGSWPLGGPALNSVPSRFGLPLAVAQIVSDMPTPSTAAVGM
mmetsp:Transcript_16571/g.34612  ORF Transcript_16571/g.34612 Transcript_16571/m.34612 type:complete len:90 (-) Transcript_16571:103-372(-)